MDTYGYLRMNGKGDRSRVRNYRVFRNAYDSIFRKKKDGADGYFDLGDSSKDGSSTLPGSTIRKPKLDRRL